MYYSLLNQSNIWRKTTKVKLVNTRFHGDSLLKPYVSLATVSTRVELQSVVSTNL